MSVSGVSANEPATIIMAAKGLQATKEQGRQALQLIQSAAVPNGNTGRLVSVRA